VSGIDVDLLALLGIGSLVMFVASALAVPWYIVRVPPDHFAQPWRRGRWLSERPGWQRAVLVVLKNVLGVVLLVAGIAMLVLPGQGLLTILVSLVLLDLPGKHALERRIILWPPLFRTLNHLRRRAGRAPLVPPTP
jgi:hypothetical protein